MLSRCLLLSILSAVLLCSLISPLKATVLGSSFIPGDAAHTFTFTTMQGTQFTFHPGKETSSLLISIFNSEFASLFSLLSHSQLRGH